MSAGPSASINLRDALLAALSTLPGIREFHVHVLVSAPRKNTSLFPYAHPRPKSYLHDVLILCSEQDSSTPDAPRILVSAIAANVYHIPSTSSAVIYVSKVDSTGQGKGRAPTTALVRAFLAFYADPATRPVDADHLWIQLFARAQAQYLFPNSAEFPGKQPLTDAKLCSWWKRVLSQVVVDVQDRAKDKTRANAFYVLPGYDQPEAEDLLRVASSSTPPLTKSASWTYGHPYSTPGVQLPCPREEGEDNLGTYIPWFDDDPKSRFLDEIALIVATSEGILKSPAKKRPKRELQGGEGTGTLRRTSDADKSAAAAAPARSHNKEDTKAMGELTKVSPDEFWERMSFRQECVAGAVTGFFTLVFSPASTAGTESARRSTTSPLAPRAGQVGPQMVKRVMTSLLTGVEFSTREKAIRSTETVESAIKGLCEGMVSAPPHAAARRENTVSGETKGRPRTPPPRTRVGLAEISPNPFPEPIASVDTYQLYIYGAAAVRSSATDDKVKGQGEGVVTVLTARRKKKRT